MKPRVAAVFLLTVIGVLISAYAARKLAPHIVPGEHLLTNDKEVPWPLIIPVFALSALLVRLVGTALIAVGVGLFAGGWCSNLIERSQAPVLDYIPLPEPFVVVANLADMALFAGVTIILFCFFRWMLRTAQMGKVEIIVTITMMVVALNITLIGLFEAMMNPDALHPPASESTSFYLLSAVMIGAILLTSRKMRSRRYLVPVSMMFGGMAAHLLAGPDAVGVYGVTPADVAIAAGTLLIACRVVRDLTGAPSRCSSGTTIETQE